MNKIIPLFFAIFFINGCASTNTYVVPANGQPLTKIAGHFHRSDMFTWQRTELLSIDNKTISSGFFDGINTPVLVMPGIHDFTAKATVSLGFSNGPYEAITDVKTSLKPGINYHLNCAVNGGKINVWVEDAAGTRISPIFSAPFHSVPIDDVAPIVIVQ